MAIPHLAKDKENLPGVVWVRRIFFFFNEATTFVVAQLVSEIVETLFLSFSPRR